MTTNTASNDDSPSKKPLSYAASQRLLAAAWKARTTTLPEAARAAAPWIDQRGDAGASAHAFCLPRDFAAYNLLPAVRDEGVALLADLGIPWHCGVDGGPGNHLLSSQVQCANALLPMVGDPARIARAFGRHVDIAEVLEIEPGRHMTFEYIGPTDFFGEGAGKPRTRGSNCTSVDAAFRYCTSGGAIELALVEWKYVEAYRRRRPDPRKDLVRALRYGKALLDPKGPVRADAVPFHLLLDEPIYQLVRQQLLAHELEKAHAEGADVVHVLHVLAPANTAYQASLTRAETKALGATVDEVWQRLLSRPDRFQHVDPEVFLDPAVTSPDYVDRYRPQRGA